MKKTGEYTKNDLKNRIKLSPLRKDNILFVGYEVPDLRIIW